MPRFIHAWRKDTGQKLDHPIPDSWIRDGVNPNLTDTDPGAPANAEDQTVTQTNPKED